MGMRPTAMRNSRGSGGGDGVEMALQQLERFAKIMPVKDAIGEAVAPILHPSVQAAIDDWRWEIQNPKIFTDAGIKVHRTALFEGPPGTGKTSLAHNFAARLGLPLVCIQSEDIIDCYVGSTGKNLGAVFDALDDTVDDEGHAHAVVLFDEVDSIGSRRMGDSGASQERASSLNVMLRRVEQFQGIAIAATNRADMLDAALWRRFGMQITVALPREAERFAILKRYASPFEIEDTWLDALTTLTAGTSPALLRGLMEGMKRAIVIAEHRKRLTDTPVSVFQKLVSSLKPPPEMAEVPPLWSGKNSVNALVDMPWPPQRRKLN